MIDLMLRACEPIGALAGAEDSKVAARSPRGGRRRSFHNPLSGCHRLQAVSHQDVVGESKPAQDGVDLGLAAHGEPGEAPLAEARVDAFAHGATPVDRSEEHTYALQSLMRNSDAVYCLQKKKQNTIEQTHASPPVANAANVHRRQRDGKALSHIEHHTARR